MGGVRTEEITVHFVKKFEVEELLCRTVGAHFFILLSTNIDR
jgi:hypothetical protein